MDTQTAVRMYIYTHIHTQYACVFVCVLLILHVNKVETLTVI